MGFHHFLHMYTSCVWSYHNQLFTVHHLGYYSFVSLVFGTTIPTSFNILMKFFTLVSPVFPTYLLLQQEYCHCHIQNLKYNTTYHYLIIRKYYCQCKSVVRLDKESNFSEIYILSTSSLLRADLEGCAYIVDAGAIV